MSEDIKIPTKDTDTYEDAKLVLHPSANDGLVYVYTEFHADGHTQTSSWALVPIPELKEAVRRLDG